MNIAYHAAGKFEVTSTSGNKYVTYYYWMTPMCSCTRQQVTSHIISTAVGNAKH